MRGYPFLPVLLLSFLSGCGPKVSPLSGVETAGALGEIEAYRVVAYENATNSTVVRHALGEKGQQASVAVARENNRKQVEENQKLLEDKLRLEGELRQERDQWIGDRGKRYIWWFVGSVTALWLAGGLLGTYLSAASGGTSWLAGKIFINWLGGGFFKALSAQPRQNSKSR